jgi:phosphoglycerol transferase MdoB-like AlkP superfamily enzyme
VFLRLPPEALGAGRDRRDPLPRFAHPQLRVGALALAALLGFGMSDRRGPVLGLLAFLTYGSMLGAAAALSFSGLRRWSAAHVVLDGLFVVPVMFFALLLIPMLPWWGAALISLVAGAVFVPIAVHRRRHTGVGPD